MKKYGQRWTPALQALLRCEGHEHDGELAQDEVDAREQALLLCARLLERTGVQVDRDALNFVLPRLRGTRVRWAPDPGERS